MRIYLFCCMAVIVMWGFGSYMHDANAQAVNGPTIAPPVSKSVLTGYQGIFQPSVAVTIAASSTTSTLVYLKGFELTGILLPTAFTGTAVSFLASVDGTNFYPLKTTTSGTSLSYTVAPSTFQAINPSDFAGVNYLKIVSNSSEAALRTLQLAIRGI